MRLWHVHITLELDGIVEIGAKTPEEAVAAVTNSLPRVKFKNLPDSIWGLSPSIKEFTETDAELVYNKKTVQEA